MNRIAELERHLGDPRPQARSIIAVRLGKIGGQAALPGLVELVLDSQPAVAASAIAALGAMQGSGARSALTGALARRGDRDQEEIVEQLRTRSGGAALLALLAYLPEDAEQAWQRQKSVLEAARTLADPRSADALAAYLGTDPHPHFRFKAAAALAMLGDVRAVEHLAWRLRQNAKQLYPGNSAWEAELREVYRLVDQERVSAAWLITEVAELHPERRAVREQTEQALLSWLAQTATGHAVGMRALVKIDSERGRKLLSNWTTPGVAFQQRGKLEHRHYEVAGQALRYLGAFRREPSRRILLNALLAQPQPLQLVTGAAQGFAEWGDPQAIKPLLEVIRDTTQHQSARETACQALVWSAGDQAGALIVDELKRHPDTDSQHELTRRILLRALSERPAGVSARQLFELLTTEASPGARRSAAFALGRKGFGADVEEALLGPAEQGALTIDATTALMLGGKSPDGTTRLRLPR